MAEPIGQAKTWDQIKQGASRNKESAAFLNERSASGRLRQFYSSQVWPMGDGRTTWFVSGLHDQRRGWVYRAFSFDTTTQRINLVPASVMPSNEVDATVLFGDRQDDISRKAVSLVTDLARRVRGN